MNCRQWLTALGTGVGVATSGCVGTIIRNSPLAPADAVYFDHIEYDPETIQEGFAFDATVTQPNIHSPDQPLTIEVTIRNQREADGLQVDKRFLGLYANHLDHEFQWFEVDDVDEDRRKTFDADARVWRADITGQPLVPMIVDTLDPGETASMSVGLFYGGEDVPSPLPEQLWFHQLGPVYETEDGGKPDLPRFRLAQDESH